MDFKSILNKLDSFSAPQKGVSAPKLADPIRLDEGTELRVLAGMTQLTESVIAEKKLSTGKKDKAIDEDDVEEGPEILKIKADQAKSKGEKTFKVGGKTFPVKEGMKVGDTKKSASGGTIEKTKTGIKHTKKDTYDGEAHVDEPKKKVSKAAMTGAERQAQKAKDKEQSKTGKDYAKKNPGTVRKYVDGKLVKEAAKPDFLDIDKDGDKKEPMKKAAGEKGGAAKKDGEKKGMSDKQAKYFGKKKAVKESLSFTNALKIVKESQGQFQIDPMDKVLWSWAERVGKSRFNESVQAQAFAAATYERMGGEWGLHKVITE